MKTGCYDGPSFVQKQNNSFYWNETNSMKAYESHKPQDSEVQDAGCLFQSQWYIKPPKTSNL